MAGAAIYEVYRQMAEELARRPVIADNRTDWRRRYDEMVERETPEHPDIGVDAEIEHINGPNVKSEYARNSVEWEREQRRKADAAG
jgi:hypothetical protein